MQLGMQLGMQLRSAKVMVTGGAGFIGSHLAERLVDEGCRVVVVDNLSSGHMTNLEHLVGRIEFVKGDIRNAETMVDSTRGCDIIFHHAAVVSVTRTVDQPFSTSEINDLGTLQVLEAARLNGVRRVVLASSSAVYGDDPQLPKTESMAPKPLSPYAVQKLANEFYARLYNQLYGVQTICLRYFNVFGPRQDPSSPYSGVISIFLTKAVKGEQPKIYGDGTQTRDFIFVKDVVRANLLAAESESVSGNVYNVGSGRFISINALWSMIAGMAGCRQLPEHVACRAGDILHSVSDIDQARRSMKFDPKVDLQDGLEQTLAWYKSCQ